MKTKLSNLLKSMSNLDAQQVINKLRVEIEFLWEWAINKGDGNSPVFYEKMRSLREKIEEREKFEKLLENE